MSFKSTLPEPALAQLFTDAHTQGGWLAEPVPDAMLRQLYALACMGPTSMNCQPMRLVFLSTAAAKERLVPALSPGNVDKTRAAPVTAIVAYDTQFFELMPQVWPAKSGRDMFANNATLAASTATRNGTLGGGYLILAARALGLDCGPMSGVDLAKVNAEFFADGRCEANFILNLGYGDDSKLFDRNPRLSFEQACSIL